MNLPREEFQEEEMKLYAQTALQSELGKDFMKKKNPIKQVLLLRDRNKNDKQGVPKSRGIGFIEFETHEQALAFLEHAVKDKYRFEKTYKRTPIIEFAIEDIRKMQRKHKITEKVKKLQSDKQSENKPKSKGDREDKKLILQNANNASKLQIEETIASADVSDMKSYDAARRSLNDIKSRGLK